MSTAAIAAVIFGTGLICVITAAAFVARAERDVRRREAAQWAAIVRTYDEQTAEEVEYEDGERR